MQDIDNKFAGAIVINLIDDKLLEVADAIALQDFEERYPEEKIKASITQFQEALELAKKGEEKKQQQAEENQQSTDVNDADSVQESISSSPAAPPPLDETFAEGLDDLFSDEFSSSSGELDDLLNIGLEESSNPESTAAADKNVVAEKPVYSPAEPSVEEVDLPSLEDSLEGEGNIDDLLGELGDLPSLELPAEAPSLEESLEGEGNIDDLLGELGDLPSLEVPAEAPSLDAVDNSIDDIGDIASEQTTELTTSPLESTEAETIDSGIDAMDIDEDTSTSEIAPLTTSNDSNTNILSIIKSFEKTNQKILYLIITEVDLDEDELSVIKQIIISGEDEANIVKKVSQFVISKGKISLEETITLDDEASDISITDIIRNNLAVIIGTLSVGILLLGLFFLLFSGLTTTLRSNYLYDKGIDRIQEDDYEEAERYYKKAYKLKPNLKKINEYATEYMQLDRFLDAEKKLNDALTIDSSDFESLVNFARLRRYQDDYAASEKRYNQLIVDNPQNTKLVEELGDLYIEWGRINRDKLVFANEIFNKLVIAKGNLLKYLIKKMQIEIRRDNYKAAKYYFNVINNKNQKYLHTQIHGEWLDYLQNIYHDYLAKKGEDKKKVYLYEGEHFFVVQTISDLIFKFVQQARDYLPNYYYAAKWKLNLGDVADAEVVINDGLKHFEQKGSTNKEFSPGNLYNMHGLIKYQQGNIRAASKSFQTAIDFDPYNSTAHYQLGIIYLRHLTNFTRAQEHLNLARFYWVDKKTSDYQQLLYSLGYVYYLDALDDSYNEEGTADKYRAVLRYWNELSDFIPNHYIISYAQGIAYLSLREYELAEAEFKVGISVLKKYLDMSEEFEGDVSGDITKRVEVLSELYNNVGVSQIGQYLERINPIVNKREALNNFVNAATIKDKLSLIKGAPIVNYNLVMESRLNTFGQLKISHIYLPLKIDKAELR